MLVKKMVLKNFIETSYGSLKESRYLLEFAQKRKWLTDKQSMELLQLSENIGKMLWGILRKLEYQQA